MKMILRRLAMQLPRKFFSLNRPLLQAAAETPPPDDHSKLIKKWAEDLENAKVPEVQSSLDNILGHILQTKQVGELSLKTDIQLTEPQREKFDKLCDCRMARMPIQYIVGEWDFRDLTLQMQPPVFIPRPETEEIVELILQQQIDLSKRIRFLEIGCGSGAISLALLKSLPNAMAEAADQSSMACLLTMKNAINLKLNDRIKVIQSKINDRLKCDFKLKYDFIVSNPPYVPSRDLMNLEPEIRLYEDLRALDGGEDGLSIIKIIIQMSGNLLKSGGTLWLEVDPSHPEMIQEFIEQRRQLNLKYVASYPDLFNNERFVEILRL